MDRSRPSTKRLHRLAVLRSALGTPRWLHRYAVLLAALTWCLIVAGGLVTSHEAGLSVPDWPTTYGHNMFTFPPSKWVGGILYEHSHRLIASTVGLLTIGLAVWLQRVDPRPWLRRLGWVALAVVIVQGVLGGLTVKYLLPLPVSVAHACLAQSFLCLTVAIAVVTSPWWRNAPPPRASTGRWNVRGIAGVFVAAVLGQLVLGALARHTKSGLAVPDFPKAYSQWLPSLDEASVAEYNVSRRWDMGWLPEVQRHQILIHLLHRGGAVVVTGMFVVAAVAVRRAAPALPAGPTAMVGFLLAVQWGLGAAVVLMRKPPWLATAHVAVGAAVLAGSVVMWLVCARRMARRSLVVSVPAAAMAPA